MLGQRFSAVLSIGLPATSCKVLIAVEDPLTQSDETPNQPDEIFVTLLKQCDEATRNGDNSEMENVMMQLFSHIAVTQEKEGIPPAVVLAAEANALAQQHNWVAVESTYLMAIKHASALNSPAHEFKAYEDLSELYSFLRDDKRATEAALSALRVARLSGNQMVLLMALRSCSRSLLKVGRIPEALSQCEEALKLCEARQRASLPLVSALITRARCSVAMKRFQQADKDLSDAWLHIEPQKELRIAAGVQSTLAAWWAARASLLTTQQEHSEAADAWKSSVDCRRAVCEAPQVTGPYKFGRLADSLGHLSEALTAINDLDGAARASEESIALRAAIGQPGFN